jgi:nickel/cobalt transporter (NicO) family protein
MGSRAADLLSEGDTFDMVKTRYSVIPVLLATLFCCTMLGANPFFSDNSTNEATDPQKQESTLGSGKKQAAKELLPVRIGQQNREILAVQNRIQEKMGNLLYNLKNGKEPPGIILTILFAAFLYGMLHALGPGHRKTVVFSLYIVRKAPWWEPAMTAFILAMLHGISAIVYMSLISGIAGSIAQSADKATILAEGYSFAAIILATLILMGKETAEFCRKKPEKNNGKPESSHVARLLPFLITGVYPCPGAILILAFCYSIGIRGLGNICILSMSLGMVIPVMAVAYLAWSGREGLFNMLRRKEGTAENLSFGIEMGGYVLMLVCSLYIAWPFLYSLFHSV